MGRWLHWQVVVVLVAGIACGALAALWVGGAHRQPMEDNVARKAGTKVYIVRKLYWHYRDRSEPFQESDPPGAGFPEKVFGDRAAAEAYRRDREREERKGRCPFEHGRGDGPSFPSLDRVTSTPTGEFIGWLAAEGLNPPPEQLAAWEADQRRSASARGWDPRSDSFRAWWSWWDANLRGREGEPVCDRVWDKLDQVRFFEVVETEVET